MKPINSTSEILALKMLGRNVDKRWTQWAYGMLIAGFETDDLIIFAGETDPFNQFEMKRLTDRVFRSLGLTWGDSALVLRNYTCYLVDNALSQKKGSIQTLEILKDLCIELDYDRRFMDFYLLYYAYDDLRYSEMQWYWPDANRENIDHIILNYFENWERNNK